MSERMVLTIGWMPPDGGAELIIVGDPSLSGTCEIDIEIVDMSVHELGNGRRFDGAGLDWFDDACEVFRFLHSVILEHGGSNPPAPQLLAKAWALFQWELDVEVPEFLLIQEAEAAAEFDNAMGQYDGCYYLRYVLEDGTEVYGEQLVVIRPATPCE